MNVVYVLKAFGGQYDDRWESNVCASLDLNVIEEELKKKEADKIKLRDDIVSNRVFRNEWMVANPRPDVLPYTPEKYPSFAHFRQSEITEEMRNNRAVIVARNEAAQAAAFKPQEDWSGARWEATVAFLASIGRKPEEVTSDMENACYEIETVELK